MLSGSALFIMARLTYPYFLKRVFNLRGRVEIAERLAETASRPNSMLFVVARNTGGVPVAVKKIINPVFPVEFRIASESLIMPELLTKTLFLETFLNTHGELGIFKPGDIKGALKRPVFFRKNNITLILNTAAK